MSMAYESIRKSISFYKKFLHLASISYSFTELLQNAAVHFSN